MANAAELAILLRLKDADKAVAGFRKVGQQFQSIGRELTIGLTAPLAALGGVSLKTAIDFESSFAGVRKTVNATEEEFTALASGMRSLAKEIPVNVNELNRIGEAAGQLGIETKNILTFTDTIAKLGVTTNLASDEAATALARFANVTQLPQDEIGNLGSTIVELGNTMATTEAEIVNFGLRIAGAGKVAGLTESDILAIAAAMSSVGVEAEAGGTAVQKVLLGMKQAVAAPGKELEAFARVTGKTVEEFAELFERDASEAFTEFVEGLQRSGDDAFEVLEELGLTDQRLIRSFLSLANAGDILRSSINKGSAAFATNTALGEEAEKRFGTTASKATLLKNQLQDVAISLGTALIPALTAALDAAQPFIGAFEQAVALFSALPQPVQMGIVGIAGLAAALGPMLLVIGQAIKTMGAFNTVLATGRIGTVALGTAIKGALVTTGIGALLIALPLVIEHWDKIWHGIKKTFEVVSDAIVSAYTSKWGWLLPGGMWVKSILFIKENWESAWNGIKSFFEKIADGIKAIWDKTFGAIMAGIDKIKNAAEGVGDAFGKLTPGPGGGIFGIPGIPGLQHGVQNFRGGLAVVGERGPEIVSLPRGSQVYPTGTGPGGVIINVPITFNAPIYGIDDLDRKVVRSVRDAIRGGGFNGVIPGL